MEEFQRCLQCDAVMNFLGNNPSPVVLSCNHLVCLTCVNTQGEWSPQQPQKECQFQCPNEVCAVQSQLDLNQINMQLNIVRQSIQEQKRNQIGQEKENVFKCSVHTKKSIEFKCNNCLKFLCSLCVLNHQKNCGQVVEFTDYEIIQESNRLCAINNQALQKVSKIQQQLLRNKEKLEQITKKKNEIYSEQIQEIFKEVNQSFTEQIVDELQNFQDVEQNQLNEQIEEIIDSKIITSISDKQLFLTLFDKKQKFNLLMRGSEDGFKGQTFLDKCKNKGKTVTIVKAVDGKVFGGYTDLDFNGNGKWVNGNKNSFLFAFLGNKVVKCKCINSSREMVTSQNCFLCFGFGSLAIKPDCNINLDSYGDELGSYFEQSTLPTKYLAGKEYFQVDEFEIYQVLE